MLTSNTWPITFMAHYFYALIPLATNNVRTAASLRITQPLCTTYGSRGDIELAFNSTIEEIT